MGRGKTAEALGEWTAIGPAQLGHSIRGADVATGPGGGGLQAAQGDAGFRIQKAVLGKKPRPIPTEQPSETLGERKVQAGDSWKDWVAGVGEKGRPEVRPAKFPEPADRPGSRAGD